MEEHGYSDDVDLDLVTNIFLVFLILPILFFFLYITLARANII
jgi:hypothetical protein